MKLTEKLTVHGKETGGLCEVLRDEDWGQVALFAVPPGETRGGHRHDITDEKWIVIKGHASIRLEYPPDETGQKIRVVHVTKGIFETKSPKVFLLPPGTGHDIKNLSETEDLLVMFWASRVYRKETHDKAPWHWEG